MCVCVCFAGVSPGSLSFFSEGKKTQMILVALLSAVSTLSPPEGQKHSDDRRPASKMADLVLRGVNLCRATEEGGKN